MGLRDRNFYATPKQPGVDIPSTEERDELIKTYLGKYGPSEGARRVKEEFPLLDENRGLGEIAPDPELQISEQDLLGQVVESPEAAALKRLRGVEESTRGLLSGNLPEEMALNKLQQRKLASGFTSQRRGALSDAIRRRPQQIEKYQSFSDQLQKFRLASKKAAVNAKLVENQIAANYKKGFWSGIGSVIGAGLGALVGGPAGAVVGGSIGNTAGKGAANL